MSWDIVLVLALEDISCVQDTSWCSVDLCGFTYVGNAASCVEVVVLLAFSQGTAVAGTVGQSSERVRMHESSLNATLPHRKIWMETKLPPPVCWA